MDGINAQYHVKLLSFSGSDHILSYLIRSFSTVFVVLNDPPGQPKNAEDRKQEQNPREVRVGDIRHFSRRGGRAVVVGAVCLENDFCETTISGKLWNTK